MTISIRLREAKALLSANKVVEANNLVEALVYSLLDAENPRQAARANLVFLRPLSGEKAEYRPNRPMRPAVRLKCPPIQVPSVSSLLRC